MRIARLHGVVSQGEPTVTIFVVSDGTGETAAAAVRAVILQFQNRFTTRLVGAVRHESQVRRVIDQAAEVAGLVVFSMVDKPIVDFLLREAERQGVATVDLLGPMISKIAHRVRAEPRHEPGLLHGFSDEYFERVEAVEFAVRHDDGNNTHSLHEADIVLTGPSRASKTPLSMYLAQRGYKTGNVPLLPGVAPPQALLELDPKKVFGLLIDVTTLLEVRQARVRALKASPRTKYTDRETIEGELYAAKRLFRQQGWTWFDISGRAVEENASRILEAYTRSGV